VSDATTSALTADGRDSGRGSRRRQLLTTVAGFSAALVGLQCALWYLTSISATCAASGKADREFIIVALVIGVFLAVGIIWVGIAFLRTQNLVEIQHKKISIAAVHAAAALDAFATEELRVRREVADGLHGTVQHNLVMISVRLAAVANAIEKKNPTIEHTELAELAEIRADIDNIREHDVRTMSQLLYPVGIDIGAIAAIRLLIQRLPATIAGKIVVSEEIVELEGFGPTSLTIERRLMIVRIVEEALTNALRHGSATSVSVAIGLRNGAIVVQFDDDGTGLGELIAFRGIARMRERLGTLGGSIMLANDSALGGVRLIARIPL
jgi:two-component system sensor histidine kinase UhpB